MRNPSVLVACEYSGRVRDAFAARGWDAISCDLLPSETPGNHFQGDVATLLKVARFDLMIAFPPCTHLSVSGARWWPDKTSEQLEALDFVRFLMDASVDYWAIENPVGKISSAIRKPDQIIHPWQFGHGEAKTTCLWTKGLPALTPTDVVEGRENRIHRMSPGPNRWKERSRTYAGIAQAMADQWGSYVEARIGVSA
jgi:site-specific DNA-cytosine methylase